MEGDRECRFAHLLQPIRDIAMNWDIDVASALEEYLEDLEGLTISLGDELQEAVGDPLAGKDKACVNFAEAALLIQVRARGFGRRGAPASSPDCEDSCAVWPLGPRGLPERVCVSVCVRVRGTGIYAWQRGWWQQQQQQPGRRTRERESKGAGGCWAKAGRS